MSEYKSDVVDISAAIKAETPKAYMLFDGAATAWFPKAQVENNKDGTFTMPEWLAKDRGFI